jgi:Carboxypeptidase regulatory-like domain/Reeler domain
MGKVRQIFTKKSKTMNTSPKNIKTAAVILFVGFAVIAFTAGTNFVTTTKATIPGPPASRTGAPGESNCTACHVLDPNTGSFSISPPATYTPGTTYTITVRHTTSDLTRMRWGFELTALSSANISVGTLTATSTRTKVISNTANTRKYMEHTTSGTYGGTTGGAVWTFNWTAPATNVGPVTFYAAGIQADDTGDEFFDQMYLTNAVSTPFAPTAADASIHGRLLTPTGRGLSNAFITLTDTNSGEVRTVRSTSFGYFNFNQLESGDFYILSVQSKRYTFENRSFTLNDNIDDLVLTGQ